MSAGLFFLKLFDLDLFAFVDYAVFVGTVDYFIPFNVTLTYNYYRGIVKKYTIKTCRI